MLAYPHSPVDSMAQLVPCSGGFMSPQQQQEFYSCKSSSGGLGGPAPSSAPVLVDISVYAGSCGGQSVPSSPTFSTYNYSPPSYWSESPTVVKSEPYSSNPLDDLLDDISFESSLSVAAPVKSEGHSLLIECLRPSSNESQLEYLNQIGSQVIGSQQDMNCQSSTFLSTLSIKTEEKSYNCWANPPVINPNPAVQGLRGVLGLIMEEVNEEVRTTCEILGLLPNPSQWTVQDVKAWLQWMSRKYELGPFPLERFDMEGAALASLTEEEFRTRAPQGGDTIYAKLDIWRSAWNQHKAIQLQQLQQQQVSPTSPPATHQIPTIQVDEPAPADISDFLSCWISDTHQDLQQPNMLSASNQQHLLCVHPVSPASVTSSSLRGALSPYSDHSGISCSEDMTSEVEEMEDEEEAMLNRMGDSSDRSASAASSRAAASPNGSHIHLWQFLKELLSQPTVHGSAIRWLDRTRGVFKIEDSVRVARLWGKRKNRPAMNYDKLSRSIRQYYRKGIMKKTERSQRLVYQFCHPYAL